MLEDFSLRSNITFGFGCWHNFLSAMSVHLAVTVTSECVPSCTPENIVAAVTLGWMSFLIESQEYVFFFLILFWSLLTILVCIHVCFHQTWFWVASIYHGHFEPFGYKKKYTRICFLSLCWCPPSVCIGLVQGEIDVIPVLFLCSILFTRFCIVTRCSAL